MNAPPITPGWPPAEKELADLTGGVLSRVADRRTEGRDHGDPNTVVEELLRQSTLGPLARNVWERMKIDTGEAFRPDPDHYVGAKMVQQLIRQFYERGKTPRITLLGHSTGAIYICKFLRAVDAAVRDQPYQDRVKFDVVFMAPAVRVDEFAYTLYQVRDRIRAFRMFGMHDSLESREALIKQAPQVYTSSLLYFVSGVCENDDQDYDDTPLLGMERFFSDARPFTRELFPAIREVKEFLNAYPHAAVFSDTPDDAPPGLRCAAHEHGGFPSEKDTLESVCWLLRTGDYR